MSTEKRDPIFDSLDRLAGLADQDIVGDRMGDIRRRVRVARQRKVAGGVVAAAVVVAAGLGASQLLSGGPSTIDPAPPVPSGIEQRVTIDATPAYSDLIQIRVGVEGTSSAFTDAATGAAAPAGPLNIQVVVDGVVVQESKAADVTCEPGGEVSTYSVGFPAREKSFVPADVDGPGEHVVEVRAPYCADGELVDEVTTQTVVTSVGEPVVADELTSDIDGDGSDDTVQVVTPAPGEQGDTELVVTLADGTMVSRTLADTSEWTLDDPQDLDGDGTQELVLLGGGGESALFEVYQLDGSGLAAVPTLNESGSDEPLAFSLSETGPQNVSEIIELTDSGFVSYRYQDANPTRPAPVEVRRWVLTDGTLTLQDANEPGCVDADFTLTLGGC